MADLAVLAGYPLPIDTSATAPNGTWTPTFSFATPGTSSFSIDPSTAGRYMIAGPQIFVNFFVLFTPTIGTGSGDLLVNGLPYPIVDSQMPGPVANLLGSLSFGTGRTQLLSAIVSSNPSSVRLRATGSGVAGAYIGASNLTSGSPVSFTGSISYRIVT